MTSALDIAVTRRYGRAHASLRERFGILAGAAWTRLESYDEADIDIYAAALAAQTAAARQQAALLTAGYLNHFTATRQGINLPDLSVDVWRPPFITVWAGLKRGDPWEAAVAAGHDRAMSTAGQIVTASARETATVIDENEPRIIGWNRVPSGACCDWCAEMAQVDWGSAAAASLGDQHANCGCDLVPITDDSAPGQVLTAPLADAPADSRYVTPDGEAADEPT